MVTGEPYDFEKFAMQFPSEMDRLRRENHELRDRVRSLEVNYYVRQPIGTEYTEDFKRIGTPLRHCPQCGQNKIGWPDAWGNMSVKGLNYVCADCFHEYGPKKSGEVLQKPQTGGYPGWAIVEKEPDNPTEGSVVFVRNSNGFLVTKVFSKGQWLPVNTVEEPNKKSEIKLEPIAGLPAMPKNGDICQVGECSGTYKIFCGGVWFRVDLFKREVTLC